MPDQDLRKRFRGARVRGPVDWRARGMRCVLLAASAALTAGFAREMHAVLAVGDLVGIEAVLLGLFVLNIAWICVNTISALLGPFGRPVTGAEGSEPATGRTAILLPTYNEDPASVVGVACATLAALAQRGLEDRFDLFILSDTTQPDLWLAEQMLVDRARAEMALGGRLFYRHRSINRHRKVGNVTDWVTRWGGAYPYTLVLDADSLMEAETIVALTRRLEATPTAGLIQTVPRLVGARTPLARLQQFAGRVYGPALARGIAVWFGDAGNYWGHNAVLRTEAFAACAGLPVLPGKQPFGGLILSHDFVEAGLLRRAGYGVYLAADLGGSFERAPPNLIEMVSRDRRWAQGNLQHLGLLGIRGLHPLSRVHMAMGALAYLASPLWLMFLLVGMALALYARIFPPDYFPDGWALFPTWPQIDAQRAIVLFVLCFLVLYLPKIVGLAGFLRASTSRGQRLRAFPDMVGEFVLSALTAPLLMLTQTRAVWQILTGRDSGWNAQARDADRLPWPVLWRFHGRHVLVGVMLATAAGAISWSLLAWMSPALLSMLIAVPLGAFLGSARAGAWMTRVGMLQTPEDRHPPEILRETEAMVVRLSENLAAPSSLEDLLQDDRALARHFAWLDGPTERKLGETDAVLAAAWLKITDGLPLSALDARQSQAVMASSGILRRLTDSRPVKRMVAVKSLEAERA